MFAHCNCMAGLSEACSNVGALLFSGSGGADKGVSYLYTGEKQVGHARLCETSTLYSHL